MEKVRTFDKELFYRALADRTRLRLLNLLADGEVCVCFLVEILGASQPKVSRHLAYLRRAGVVASRREGTWGHYRITPPADPNAARVLAETLVWLAKDAEMRADRKRLVQFSCASELPVPLRGAPRPNRTEPAARPV